MRFQRLITLLILILPACQSSAAVAGTAGIGDPLFTNLGNGGYDVQRYDLVLDVDPEANRLRARVVIDAVALEQLKQFNLDFENLTIETVEVNGKPAEFARSGGELTITPPRPLTKGWNFSVRIVYNGEPQPLKPITSAGIIPPPGWHHAQSGAINVMSEPNGAAGWFPLNNHPRDKALYRINIGVPAPWVAVAPGVLKETRAEGASIRYIWEMQRPMAGYLASVNIGRYQDDVAAGPHDVLIRSYFPAVLNLDAQLQTAKIPDMLVYFESVFGRYPFLQYGVLQADESIPPCHSIVGGAMEVQTIPVICPEGIAREAVMAHELAHQWFGNSVSLKNWQDLWLKEGAATYAEWLWDYRDKNLSDLNAYVADVLDGYTPEGITGAPTADNLYGYYTYIGGALVFHALRLQIGDERFFHLLREYLNRYQYANAGTRDFTDLAEEISGQDLTAFFNAWLYNKPPRQLPSP